MMNTDQIAFLVMGYWFGRGELSARIGDPTPREQTFQDVCGEYIGEVNTSTLSGVLNYLWDYALIRDDDTRSTTTTASQYVARRQRNDRNAERWMYASDARLSSARDAGLDV